MLFYNFTTVSDYYVIVNDKLSNSHVCARNLLKSQQRLEKLGHALEKVDREVAEMRRR